ncbi:MAG: RagB/SusD family nutrient uptake outer membrane protein [Ginsengibacter sp.]
MKQNNFYKSIAGVLTALIMITSCTKLDQHVYSVVPQQDFWQTPQQIKAGIAPGYRALTAIGWGSLFQLVENSSDEAITPTRGGDWFDGGEWQALWKHTWTSTTSQMNGAWNNIYTGIGRINFALNSLDNLKEKPDNIASINAELKVLRAYFYYLAMDLYGNVPLVIDLNTNPDSVTNSSRQQVYTFIEKEVKDNIAMLSANVNASTYGRVTKWMGFSLLAKLYLNAQVYTGTAHWQDCINVCDSIMGAGIYSLAPEYFDNFSPNNDASPENIFVVPFDKVNITGNSFEVRTLHYQSGAQFGTSGGGNNGTCSLNPFYQLFDTTSVYSTKAGNVYRTYLDQRSGQWQIGQQYNTRYPYPPDKNILYKAADPSLKLTDVATGLDLIFTPDLDTISSPAASFRMAGVRSIKYFPAPGNLGNQSNDIVLFRYADILLMKAECEVRLNQNLPDALALVNQIRERAYSGNISHDWTIADVTLDHILNERGRELAWEMRRRQDLIRYEVASSKPYFSAARIPDKNEDPSDGHLLIFPIPAQQISANSNLKQNPGY